MASSESISRALGNSQGWTVATDDGLVGRVETPVFPPDRALPDFLVVRVAGRLRSRLPVVPTALVEDVDPARRIVYLRGTREQIERLPEHLPLAV